MAVALGGTRRLAVGLIAAYASLVLLVPALAGVRPSGYSFAPETFRYVLAPMFFITSAFGLARLLIKRAALS